MRGVSAIALVLLSSIGCATAGTSEFQRPTPQGSVPWNVRLCRGNPQGVRGSLVRQPDGSWKYSPVAASNPRQGVEGVAIDSRNRVACLDERNPPKGNCAHGLLALAGDPDPGSACQSQLTACQLEFDDVVALPLTLLIGSYLCYPHVGARFSEALRSSQAVYLAYQQEFAAAQDAEALQQFAASHGQDDPDRLVPAALAKVSSLRAAEQARREQQRAEEARRIAEAQAVDQQQREEESRTGRCNVNHTEEFEHLADVLSHHSSELQPTAKKLFVLDKAGASVDIKFDDGATYHALLIGRGLHDATWKDASGYAVTQHSAIFEHKAQTGWSAESRQLVAGAGDRLSVRAKGDGCVLLLVARAAPATQRPAVAEPAVDEQGRRIIQGPVEGDAGDLIGVHIVSNSVGVIHRGTRSLKIENSVISAPVCVVTPGHAGLRLLNNRLDCNVGVRYTGALRMGNVFIDNVVSGVMEE